MTPFGARSHRSTFHRSLRVLCCGGLVLAPQTPTLRVATAQCGCGAAAVAAPVATQTYRLDYRTTYDEQQVTAYRTSYETVYDAKTYTVQKPVWETQTQERRYTVQKPVWETQTREERYTVMKPVYETVIEDRSYDVSRDVVETATREEQYTVMKPVYETVMQQQVQTVRKPVYETSEREQAYTVTEPVTQMRTAYSVGSQAVDTVTPVMTPGATSLAFAPSGWAVDPATGLAVWQRGGYAWVMTPGTVVNQVNRVYQPTYTPVQVPETTYVNRVVTQKVPVQTVRYVDEQVVQQVPVQTMKMVAETAVRQVPVQTVRKVVERVDNKVPVQVMKMVPEEQVRQVAFQVCRMVTEEKVEPVQIQVMKYVTEERSMQVPRVVEKKTPYNYTVRTPRTVVMKVPLDPCGNPIPVAASAAATTAAPALPAAPSIASYESVATPPAAAAPPGEQESPRAGEDVQRSPGRHDRSRAGCRRMEGLGTRARRSDAGGPERCRHHAPHRGPPRGDARRRVRRRRAATHRAHPHAGHRRAVGRGAVREGADHRASGTGRRARRAGPRHPRRAGFGDVGPGIPPADPGRPHDVIATRRRRATRSSITVGTTCRVDEVRLATAEARGTFPRSPQDLHACHPGSRRTRRLSRGGSLGWPPPGGGDPKPGPSCPTTMRTILVCGGSTPRR